MGLCRLTEDGVELPEFAPRPRGMEPALVQTFPVHEYSKAAALVAAREGEGGCVPAGKVILPAGSVTPQPTTPG